MAGRYEQFKVDLPEGKSGDWEIKRFTIDKTAADFSSLRAVIQCNTRNIPEGHYTQLLRNGHVVMSDTPAEYWDHSHMLSIARGRVLVAGLGLGCLLNCILNDSRVYHVTVIEKSHKNGKEVSF